MKLIEVPRLLRCNRKPVRCSLFSAMIGLMLLAVGSASASQNFPSYAELANQVKHPVVNIFSTKVIDVSQMRPFADPGSPFEEFFKHFFGGQQEMKRRSNALGSGFIIDSSGLIITNNHVVEKADEIMVGSKTSKNTTQKWLDVIRRRIWL